MANKSQIFISSGGTGGHIIPARCLASYLEQEEQKVTFFGDEKYRGYIKENDQFKSVIISSSQLRKSPLALIKATLKIALGIFQSLYYFVIYRPKCLVSFGGYATFPILIAAVLTRKKIILHEQNSHLGKVNRIFAKYADVLALSFKDTSGIDKKFLEKTTFVGNLVRDEILQLNKLSYQLPDLEEEKKPQVKSNNKMGYDVLLASEFYDYDIDEEGKDFFRILVIGGSGGAKIFSEILPKAFFNLNEDVKSRIQVIQQSREELVESTFQQYKSFNINIIIDSFFENMSELIKISHLVIARSGSSSIFEFCAAKKPMILIPFALAADNHQEKNARYLEKNGAAVVLNENEFTINKVSDLLRKLINSPETLKEMSDNASDLAVLDATKNLAELAIN